MPEFTIHTSLLFDPKAKEFRTDVSLTVDPASGLITRVYTRTEALPARIERPDVDLRGKVVLPGLVDAHTHIFLHPYSEVPAGIQMRDESVVERVVRAVAHCRAALLAGYTTYRDLGTEALGDADAGVREAVNRGLMPGPRLFVATEALASSGGYALRTENAMGGVVLPRAADVADGVEGVRAAVRRRIGAGADVVKFYADYRRRVMRFPPGVGPAIQFPPTTPNPDVLLFNQAEMDAIVAEATLADCPVAAHCGSLAAVKMAARAGVTSIEHGFALDDEALALMKTHGTIFVPTAAVVYTLRGEDALGPVLAQVRRAWEAGVRLACGGDTGPFAHGDNALEMELLVRAGIPLAEVLAAGTVGGWEACGGDRCERRFGWFAEGVAADVVALEADPREDPGALRKVGFVMKDGRVWKEGGVAVGMV